MCVRHPPRPRPAGPSLLAPVAAALAGLAGLMGPGSTALAQDSVSNTPGLPGDAVSATQAGAASEQVNDYILDLSPVTGSWGSRFAVGPLVKASRSNTGQFFDLLIGAQSVSHRFAFSPLLRASYARWAAPGQGVNAAQNDAPAQSVAGSGRAGQRFGAAFMEFGSGADGLFGTGDDDNNIVAAVVDLQRRNPGRLYVSRIVAAVNKPSPTGAGTASFGLGGVDAAGNVHLYADSFGMTDPQRLSQRDYFRINAAARNPALANQLLEGGAGDAAATTLVRASATSMTTPTIIPSAVAGRAVALGLDFNGDYLYESAPGSTQATKSYLPGATGSPRGTLTFIPQVFAPVALGGNNAGTGACLVRTDSNTRTRGIAVFGVNTDGSTDSTLEVDLPIIGGQLLDPSDNWNPQTNYGVLAAHEFCSYASQASFRGGNGPVAATVLPSGEMLVAAAVTPTSGSLVPQPQDNYLAVARITAGGVATWVTAAHTGNALGAAGGVSKVILGDNGADGVPGSGDAGEGDGVVDTGPNAWIGRIARLSEVYPAQTSGPSISAPAMDRRGNLYFLATVALKKPDGNLEYTSALLRANRDNGSGSYALELLARLGDIVPGVNSGLNYQLQFMGAADADSAASGAVWSSSLVQDGLGGGDPGRAQYGSANSLGALVFRAKIVYDTDGDGVFADPSAGASNSPDQSYNAVMVLMPRPLPADFNLDGAVSVQDIFDFLAAYFASVGQAGAGDWNGDGATSVQDIFDFLADYFGA